MHVNLFEVSIDRSDLYASNDTFIEIPNPMHDICKTV